MSLESIGKGIRYIMILKFVQITATILFYHIASSVLSETDIGLMATLTFIYGILTVFSSLALPMGGVKFVSEFLGRGEDENASATARSIVRLVLTNSSIITVVMYITLTVIIFRRDSHSEIVLSLALICAASFLASLKLTYLGIVQGLELFDKYTITNTATTIVYCIVGAFLVPELGLTGFSIGFLTSEIVGLTLAFTAFHGKLQRTSSFYSYRTLLKFSIPLFFTQLVEIFSNWADRILFFSLSLNLASLGIYDLTIRSAASILVISGFVEAMALSALSKTYGQTGKRDLTIILKKAFRYLGFMYFPVAFGFAAVSRTLMVSLYSEAYVEGGLPLAILSISSVVIAFSGLLGSGLKSIGKTKAFIKISLGSLLVNIIVVISLTPLIGMIGATIARVLASLFTFILFYNELKNWIKIEFDLDGFWKGAACSIVPAISMLVFDRLELGSKIINLFLGVTIGVVVYILALILLRALRTEDFKVLRKIMPRITVFINFIEKIASRFIE